MIKNIKRQLRAYQASKAEGGTGDIPKDLERLLQARKREDDENEKLIQQAIDENDTAAILATRLYQAMYENDIFSLSENEREILNIAPLITDIS